MNSYKFGIHQHKPKPKHTSCDNHSHTHDHDHRGKDKKVLKIALAITFITMILEFMVGFIGHSLALISDAIHMFTHSFALIVSLVAIVIANKKAPIEKTFGLYRIEVLAAFINGITIILSILWIIYEAIERFLSPEIIDLQMSIIVAFIGLVVNVATGIILMQGDHNNVNLKSAFIHMLADALSSVAIIIGLVVIYYTNWYFIDIVLALIVCIVISKWAYIVLKNSINILMETSPVDINAVKQFIEKNNDKIIDIYDIHIWEITTDMYIMTAHILIEKSDLDSYEEIIKTLNDSLEHKYNIIHTTFQFEWG